MRAQYSTIRRGEALDPVRIERLALFCR